MSEPVVTYRPRAAGPGWTEEELLGTAKALARGDWETTARILAHDLAVSLRGGIHRPLPLDGKAQVNPEGRK